MGRPSQPTGDIPLGVSDPDFESEHSSFSGLAPGMRFLDLKFSSQVGSLTWLWHSELPTVVANILA